MLLRIKLQGTFKLPVVFTSSPLPLADMLSDGPDNLRTAFAMAASGHPGIYLAFDRKVILDCRAVEVGSSVVVTAQCLYDSREKLL